MERDAFRNQFTFEGWFKEWRAALAQPGEASDSATAGHWSGAFRVRRAVLEALSDAGAEQFLNPLVASHLRSFGSRIASTSAPESWFWVRSEWEKVDISYGLAPRRFSGESRGWERAWLSGATGDLGQCEVKVCYTHHYAGKMGVLRGQLEERRERDVRRRPHFERQRYHGLIWLFQHEGVGELRHVGDRLLKEAEDLRLKVLHPFLIPSAADNLGRLWPSCEKQNYECGLSLALVELEPLKAS